MARRYTPQEKEHALQCFVANDSDVSLTSAQTGIPVRTLENWRRAGILVHPTLPPPPPAPPIAPDDLDALRDLQHQMLREAYNLVHSIEDAIEDAPLSQRVAALAQLIDRIMKLSSQLPNPSRQSVIRIEYVDPEGYVHSTPPLSDEDDGE